MTIDFCVEPLLSFNYHIDINNISFSLFILHMFSFYVNVFYICLLTILADYSTNKASTDSLVS